MEVPSSRSSSEEALRKELERLRAENRRLKEIRRLEYELASLEAQNRRLRNKSPEEELKFLQAENRLLKEIERLKEHPADLARQRNPLDSARPQTTKDARVERPQNAITQGDIPLRKPLKLRYASRKTSTTGQRTETSRTLTEAEIRSVRSADDVFGAAMEYVKDGKATLIEISPDEVSVTCGEDGRALQISEAADVGDWLDALRPITESPERHFTCPVLYFDETRFVLAESLESRALEEFLQYIEGVAENAEDEGWSPLLPPGHYDSYGQDR